MFLTFPSFEYVLPDELQVPGGKQWRSVLQFGDVGWFLARLSFPKDPPDQIQTILVTWDSDLVFLLEERRAVLRSLHYVVLPDEALESPLILRSIGEVLRGTDSAAQDCEVIIFRTTDGAEFCGPLALPVPESVRCSALIARIEDPAAEL